MKKFGVVLSLVVCVMAATQAHAEKGTAIHQRATLVRAPSSRASVCRVEVLVDENYRATPDGLVLLADIYLTIYGSRGQEISHGDWQVTFTSASGAVGSFTLQPPSSEFPGQSGFASLVADFGDLSISAMPLGDVSGCAGVTLSKPIPVSGDRSSLDFPVETLFPGSPVTRLR